MNVLKQSCILKLFLSRKRLQIIFVKKKDTNDFCQEKGYKLFLSRKRLQIIFVKEKVTNYFCQEKDYKLFL